MAPTGDISVSKIDPSAIEVYHVQGIVDEETHQSEGVVLRRLRQDGKQSFQCITCRTEESYNFSPCAHIKALRRQLGVRTVVDDHPDLVSS
jgi:hypothetical protein